MEKSQNRLSLSFPSYTHSPYLPTRSQKYFPQKPIPKKPSPPIFKKPKITLKKKKIVKSLNFFIVFFLISLIFLFRNIISQEISYSLNKKNYSYPEAKKRNTPQNLTDFLSYRFKNDYPFKIYIPKINAASNISANINPQDQSSYEQALKKGVAHAAGSHFPSDNGPVFLFAHSSTLSFGVIDYNAVFYLLRKLENFDQIYIYYYGKKYLYKVTDKKIVNTDEVHILDEFKDKEVLILQTCYPPGTQLKTLLIIATPSFIEYQP